MLRAPLLAAFGMPRRDYVVTDDCCTFAIKIAETILRYRSVFSFIDQIDSSSIRARFLLLNTAAAVV